MWCCAGATVPAADVRIVRDDVKGTGAMVKAQLEDLRVGVGGFVRPGAWVPLGPAGRIGFDGFVEVTDGDGLNVRRPVAFNGAPGTNAGGWALIQAGRSESDVLFRTTETTGGGGAFEAVKKPNLFAPLEIVATLRPGVDFTVLGPDDRLWAAVDLPAGSVLGRDEIGEPLGGGGGRFGFPLRVAAFEAAGDLPAVPGGLATVRVLILEAGPGGLPAGVAETVRRWVTGGGHLILSLAPDGDLPAFVPLTAGPPGPLTAYTALEELASAGSGVGGAAVLNRLVPATARSVDPDDVLAADGRGLARGQGGSVVAEVPVGLGRVTVCGASLHAAPLRDWAGLPGFLKEIARRGPASAAGDDRLRSAGELAEQTFAAFEGRGEGASRSFSPGAVGLLILLLIMCIGPLDYLLVHRLLGRPALTWLTLPLWLAAVGGAAWAYDRGEVREPRRLEIVDLDAATGRVRGTAWANVPAPAGGRADVRFAPAAGPLAVDGGAPRLGYAAEPSGGFGGLFRGGAVGFAPGGYAIDGTAAVGVPLPEGAGVRLRLNWGGAVGAAAVRANLAVVDGRLTGAVSHDLPGTLSEALLVHGGRVYRPDPAKGVTADRLALAPGEAFRPDDLGVERRDLRGFLTQVRRTRASSPRPFGKEPDLTRKDLGDRLVASRYDRDSRDLSLILPALSFFERAGGATYTGLTNAELEDLDLSPLAATGRAILLGRLDAPLTELAVDFGDAAVPAGAAATLVRVVLPVAGGGRSRGLTDFDLDDAAELDRRNAADRPAPPSPTEPRP